MKEQGKELEKNAAPEFARPQEQEQDQGPIIEIFKKLLEYNFMEYGKKKDF